MAAIIRIIIITTTITSLARRINIKYQRVILLIKPVWDFKRRGTYERAMAKCLQRVRWLIMRSNKQQQCILVFVVVILSGRKVN